MAEPGGPDGKDAVRDGGPRKLTLLDAALLVMGGILGVGIFFTPRAVAELVPDPTAFLALWGVGGLVALCGALTFAELGATFPRAGGWFVFLREAWGPFVAFLFAWVVMGVIATGAVSVMLEICTANLAALVPALGPPRGPGRLATGAAVLILVTGVTAMGTKAGARFQNACMAIKIAAILALVGGGLFAAAPEPAARAAQAAGGATGAGSLASGMIRALLPVLFACGGWQMACYVAPQIERPQKNLPRAIVLGVAAVVVLYLALNATYVRVLGMRGLAADAAFAGRVAEVALGSAGGRILQGAIAVSALGVCIVTIVATPWMYVAMAREGLFFRRAGALHPRTGAPVAALCVQAAIALAYWLWGRAEVLVDAVVFVEWIFHGLVALALLRLRARRPELPRPFRSPAWPLAPVVYALVAAAVVLGNLSQSSPRDTGIGLAVLAAGAALYRPWRRLVAARDAGTAR
jgi:basic amino acid/polyamine antiporter, APA family